MNYDEYHIEFRTPPEKKEYDSLFQIRQILDGDTYFIEVVERNDLHLLYKNHPQRVILVNRDNIIGFVRANDINEVRELFGNTINNLPVVYFDDEDE